MRTLCLPVLLIASAGCTERDDPQALEATNAAVRAAVCAESRDDLKAALSDLADAADPLDSETRQDAIWQMVDSADCATAA